MFGLLSHQRVQDKYTLGHGDDILFFSLWANLQLDVLVGAYWVGFVIHSWNATYESLLGTNKPFPQPVPLSVSCVCCKISVIALYQLIIASSCVLKTFYKTIFGRRWSTFSSTFGNRRVCMIEQPKPGNFFFELIFILFHLSLTLPLHV